MTDLRPPTPVRPVIRATIVAMILALVWSSIGSLAPPASAEPPASEPSPAEAVSPEPVSPEPVVPEPPAISQGELVVTPRLVARATAPTSDQGLAGFSGAVANGDGTFWAVPGGGSGASTGASTGAATAGAAVPLRISLIRPRWERDRGGPGEIDILRHLTLSDPYAVVGFPIVNEDTRRRVLTGADLDIASLQRGRDGTFWIGEERGPFLLHVDRRGRLLSAPVPFLLDGSPLGAEASTEEPGQRPAGFAAMAASRRGRYLYPVLDRALPGDADPRRRVIAQYDTRRERYTGRTWTYRVDTDANLVADAQLVRGRRMLIMERDDLQGEAAVFKRIYAVDLRELEPGGQLAKTLVVDLLDLDNPADLGAGGGWGTGTSFSFGYRSVETLVPLRNGTLMIANAADRAGTPHDTEMTAQMIIVDPTAQAPAPVHPGTLVAHRGASGYRPEHTLAAYALVIRQCADVIEPDVVLTADGIPVARHENDISGTTDVERHPEFRSRRTTKTIDGGRDSGWFTEDFTLAELRTLRAEERLPEVRPGNAAFDGTYPIPTLSEVLDLARHSRTCTGKPVGVAPETKHPTYFTRLGLPIEPPLLRALGDAGLDSAEAPVIIQSFEVANLRLLNGLTEVRLAQLINNSGAPYDFVAAGDRRTYADLATRQGLLQIATYADIAALHKNLIIPRDRTARLLAPTAAVTNAHDAGLEVIGWTFRRENQFLPLDYRVGADPNATGDLVGEIGRFLGAGMDGYFTDNPDIGSQVELTP